MPTPLLESLFDDEEPRPLTVSELNKQVRGALERRFSSVWIEGEVSNFFDASSGHWYFTLADSDSQIKAACFKGSNWRIRFKPFDGLQVRIRGKVTVYEPRGEYQILAESLEPFGEGALKIAFQQIKLKLEEDGLFRDEFKRELPYFPRRVGVVTSPNGAAFYDILNVLSRRAKTVSIVLIPTRVQGESAPREIRDGVLAANEFNKSAIIEDKIDVLIVGRGGGSAEDLSAFNEEQLARAIFASEIPVISAVGHETDTSIADMVADVRAPTPSAAAEIVAAQEDDISDLIDRRSSELVQTMEYRLLELRNTVRELAMSSTFSEFPARSKETRRRIDGLQQQSEDALRRTFNIRRDGYLSFANRLSPVKLASHLGNRKTRIAVLEERTRDSFESRVAAHREALHIQMASIDALSPLAVLGRGFSLTQNARGEIVRDSKFVKLEENVKIRLAKGKLDARITRIEK